MSKWKIAAIILLLCGLVGYGYVQTLPVKQLPPPPVKPEDDPLQKWVGKPVRPWNFPADRWMNTDKPITVEDLKGSFALIEFWRTGCSHCQEAAPNMVRFYSAYKPLGLKVVAIQAGGDSEEENDWQQVQEKVREWKLNYPVTFDPKSAHFKGYGSQSYPTMLILDKNGIIRHAQNGFDANKEYMLLQALDKIMGVHLAAKLMPEPPPAAPPGMPPGGAPPRAAPPGMPPRSPGAPPVPPAGAHASGALPPIAPKHP